MTFDRVDTCNFIGLHATEIAKLARSAELPILAHLADMLALEAKQEHEVWREKAQVRAKIEKIERIQAENLVAFAP